MKIGFFITSMANGGAERVMSILVNNFAANGHDVHLFVYRNEVSFYELNPLVSVHHVYSKKNYFNKLGTLVLHCISLINTKRLIEGHKLDCLISFTTFINCTTVILAKLTSTPVIISERNEPVHFRVSFFSGLMRKLLYKSADSIVLQTSRSTDSFRAMGIKLPINKKIIFNPIDPSFFNNNQEREKSILAVGRMSFEKGHDLLLKAFAKSNFDGWKLHLIGAGVEEEKLRKLSIELGIDASIVWHGKQKNISQFLNRSAIFILPSRTEGFPNALGEAMACGCGVISFDCPNGPSELIKDKENGLLVNAEDINGLRDAINTLIGDSKFREKLGAEASKIKDKLNQTSIFLEWETHVSDVINKGKKKDLIKCVE